jgi:hypothetical protein
LIVYGIYLWIPIWSFITIFFHNWGISNASTVAHAVEAKHFLEAGVWVQNIVLVKTVVILSKVFQHELGLVPQSCDCHLVLCKGTCLVSSN